MTSAIKTRDFLCSSDILDKIENKIPPEDIHQFNREKMESVFSLISSREALKNYKDYRLFKGISLTKKIKELNLNRKEWDFFKEKIKQHIIRVIDEYISVNFGKNLCKMEKKCQDFETEITELKKQIAKLTNNDNQLKAQRQTFKKEIANFKDEISKWKDKIISKDAIISNLKDKLLNLLSNRNGCDEFLECE